MINMLPWLLILSNGCVKLQCFDKYRRWRNICGAAQRHNEVEQLELAGYNSVRAAAALRHTSKAGSILILRNNIRDDGIVCIMFQGSRL